MGAGYALPTLPGQLVKQFVALKNNWYAVLTPMPSYASTSKAKAVGSRATCNLQAAHPAPVLEAPACRA